MDVRRIEDPAAFAELVTPFLLRDAARHNLPLGLIDTLRHHPAVYPAFHLFVAERDGAVAGVTVQTPPHNLIVAAPEDDAVVAALIDAVSDAGVRPPGVIGGRPEVDAAAAAWVARHGGSFRPETRQGVYELRTVRETGNAPGAPRRATEDDLDLLDTWHEAFLSEAVPGVQADPGMRRRRLEQVLGEGGYWLWEDAGEPVSMTGMSPAPPGGARIGPVYTPRPLRGRGYATALVAHVSAEALAAGADACFLHTDLSNPTSNAIYMRVGYEWACEAADYRFEP